MKLAILFTVPSLILDVWILLLFRKQEFFRRFPVFCVYVATGGLISLVRLSSASSDYYYFRVFWSTEPVAILLVILAVYEIHRSLFRPYLSLWWFRLIFPAVTLATLLYALLKAILYPPTQASQVISLIISGELAAQYLITALTVLSLTMAHFFRISGHLLERRLIAGFAVSSSGILISALLRSAFGTTYNLLTSLLALAASIFGDCLWIVALSRPEAPADTGFPEGLTLLEVNTTLKTYLQTVKKILKTRHPP